MAKARRKKARKANKPRYGGVPHPELKAASRAQLGRDEEKRAVRPPQADASIEDPLQDWPADC